MAGSSKHVIDIQANIDDANKQLKKLKKITEKNFKELNKFEKKLGKDRLKDLDDYSKRMSRNMRDETKAKKTIWREERRARREQIRHQNKLAQMDSRAQKTRERAQKKQESWIRKVNRRGGTMALGAAAGAATGLMGMLVGGATKGYQSYLQYGKALSPMIGMNRRGAAGRGSLGVGGAGRMGYSRIDEAGMAATMGRQTGVTGPRELMQATRAYGLSGAEAGNYMGFIRRAGAGFSGGQTSGESAGGKQLRKIMEMGIYSGLERARLPEFADGVMKVTAAVGANRVGTVDPSGIAAVFAALGKGGAGFQGKRGANVLTKLQGAFTKPGGGEWGENFMRMAMGFGKPGSSTSYYEAEKMREQGVNPQNMTRLVGEVTSQFGSGQEGALAMREISGLSLEQSERIIELVNSGEMTAEKLEEIQKIADQSKSMEEQMKDAMQDIGGVLKRIATVTNRSIGVGSRVADAVEAVEDFQYKVFIELLNIMEDVAGYMKELRDLFKMWFGSDGKEQMNTKMDAYYREEEKNRYKSESLMSRKELQQQAVARQEAMESAASRSETVGSTILGETVDTLEAKAAGRQVGLGSHANKRAKAVLDANRKKLGLPLGEYTTTEQAAVLDPAAGAASIAALRGGGGGVADVEKAIKKGMSKVNPDLLRYDVGKTAKGHAVEAKKRRAQERAQRSEDIKPTEPVVPTPQDTSGGNKFKFPEKNRSEITNLERLNKAAR